MKTKAIQIKPQEAVPFSEFELSIGSRVTVERPDVAPYKDTVLLAIHIAMMAFRANQRVILRTDSLTEPLVDTQPGAVFVHPAIERFLLEVEEVCKLERKFAATAAFEEGRAAGKKEASEAQAIQLSLVPIKP